MKKYCSQELIDEYHDYIMVFMHKTLQKEQPSSTNTSTSASSSIVSPAPTQKSKSRKRKHHELDEDEDEHIFIPAFDVEAILDEKQDESTSTSSSRSKSSKIENDIQFKIRWRGWPKEYDSWTYQSFLDENSLKLVQEFRRKNRNYSNRKKNLGQKGFASNYWKELYAKEWRPYMDGMDNGQEHADYAYYFFKKYNIHTNIENIADFGFGHGKMLDAFVKRFRPKVMSVYTLFLYISQ